MDGHGQHLQHPEQADDHRAGAGEAEKHKPSGPIPKYQDEEKEEARENHAPEKAHHGCQYPLSVSSVSTADTTVIEWSG